MAASGWSVGVCQVDLSQREDDEVCVAMREEQRALERQMGHNGGMVEEVVAAVEGKRAKEERWGKMAIGQYGNRAIERYDNMAIGQ